MYGRDARIVWNRVALEFEVGDFDQGDAYFDRLVEVMRLTPPGPGLPYSITPLAIGLTARMTGITSRLDIAEATARTALSTPFGVTMFSQLARTDLALIAIERVDVTSAKEQYEALLPLRIMMTPLNHVCGQRVLGLLAHTIGNFEDAATHFEEAIAFCRKAGYRPELDWSRFDYAALQPARGQDTEAQTISTELGMRPLIDKVNSLRLELEAQPATSLTYPDGLTGREVEVLRLVAAGRTDRDIADELFISIRTAGTHVRNILNKTNSANRTEAATYAGRRDLV